MRSQLIIQKRVDASLFFFTGKDLEEIPQKHEGLGFVSVIFHSLEVFPAWKLIDCRRSSGLRFHFAICGDHPTSSLGSYAIQESEIEESLFGNALQQRGSRIGSETVFKTELSPESTEEIRPVTSGLCSGQEVLLGYNKASTAPIKDSIPIFKGIV